MKKFCAIESCPNYKGTADMSIRFVRYAVDVFSLFVLK